MTDDALAMVCVLVADGLSVVRACAVAGVDARVTCAALVSGATDLERGIATTRAAMIARAFARAALLRAGVRA